MVEHLLIGLLRAVLIHGAQMLHFDVVHLPDPLIHPFLESHHRRQVCRDCIRGPYIRGSDPVKREASRLDNVQHLQAVLAVGNTGYVLCVSVRHR